MKRGRNNVITAADEAISGVDKLQIISNLDFFPSHNESSPKLYRPSENSVVNLLFTAHHKGLISELNFQNCQF